MRRREFLVASVATLVLPTVARGEKTSVLKFIPVSDIQSLDPIWEQAAGSHGIMVFDTLYGQNRPEARLRGDTGDGGRAHCGSR
jgi:hypothetical protein